MSENEISSKIIGAAIEVHKQLGPGLLESTYETCLAYELKQMGLDVKQQQALPVVYKEVKLDAFYKRFEPCFFFGAFNFFRDRNLIIKRDEY